MPLARTALYQKGITIYISCNTNDNAEWQHTIRHIALEGRCFVINCDMLITKDSYPGDLATAPEKDAVSKGIVCRGGSCVIDPYGHDISETVWTWRTLRLPRWNLIPAVIMQEMMSSHFMWTTNNQ